MLNQKENKNSNKYTIRCGAQAIRQQHHLRPTQEVTKGRTRGHSLHHQLKILLRGLDNCECQKNLAPAKQLPTLNCLQKINSAQELKTFGNNSFKQMYQVHGIKSIH